MLNPGAVVIVDFPGAKVTKRHPAVVVSSATYHRTRPDVIVAALTSQVSSATSQTDFVLADWQLAGLRAPSAFRAFLLTYERSKIISHIGQVSTNDWQEIAARLQLAIAS